jgi:hypothetical protein
MPDDPKAALKLAIFQSVTTEAGGYYGQIVTVASSFLGGSLLFMEKIAPIHSVWSFLGLGIAWMSLVASIGCVARLRHHNLKSGLLALNQDFTGASQIDRHTLVLSWWSQFLLIVGMSALVFMGLLNVQPFSTERKVQMPTPQTDTGTTGEKVEKSIPYGRLGSGNASQQSQTNQNQGQQQQQTSDNPTEKK